MAEMTIEEITGALRAERLRRGMTLADVGAVVGVSLQQIGAWEVGTFRPRVDSLIRWANAVGLDVALVLK
jgi:transcriptional regulator with XRE-family HTH domain